MPGHAHVVTTVALACVPAILAGCSVLPDQPAATPERQAALYKSTNVCVDNQSSHTLLVRFTKYDTRQSDNSILGSGAQTCAEGTFMGANDVEGTIEKGSGGPVVRFEAGNPAIAAPELKLLDKAGERGFCDLSFPSSDGSTVRTADDGNLRYAVTRLPDTDWKQFRITVTDTQAREWATGMCGGQAV